MNTKINLTYNGQKYELEYNRMAIRLLEQNGFEFEDFMKKPMTNIQLAFTGAFVKNHKNTPQTIIDKIYKSCNNKAELIATLQRMIQETYDSLLADDDVGDEGNTTWEVMDLSPKASQK